MNWSLDVWLEQSIDIMFTSCQASRSRSYFSEMRWKDSDDIVVGDVRVAEELIALDIAIHPRHEKQMRPHQLAGFHFLVKNLVSDKPGGCILAHAPGSG